MRADTGKGPTIHLCAFYPHFLHIWQIRRISRYSAVSQHLLDESIFKSVEFCMGFVGFWIAPPPVGNTPSAPTPANMAVEFSLSPLVLANEVAYP
jgi:hypothetical protein